jgi:hypothetical protein
MAYLPSESGILPLNGGWKGILYATLMRQRTSYRTSRILFFPDTLQITGFLIDKELVGSLGGALRSKDLHATIRALCSRLP